MQTMALDGKYTQVKANTLTNILEKLGDPFTSFYNEEKKILENALVWNGKRLDKKL